MGLSPWERQAIFAVLWVEVALNFINGALSVVAPALAIGPTMTEDALEAAGAVGLEPVRWFGSLNLFVGWLLLRTMYAPRHLPLLLEALCIGDVLYLGSLAPFASAYGRLPGIAAPFVLTFVMFVARLRLLQGEDWARLERGGSGAPATSAARK